MSNLPNFSEVPCKLTDPGVTINLPNQAGYTSARSNMMPVICKIGPLLTLTTLFNVLVGQTAQPMPNFGNTGTGSAPVGPQRWPLKL